LIDELALQSVQSRLAALLVGQAERAARGEGVDAMTQAEMAAQLGTVREMIGRTLRNFKDQGLVAIDATGIVILNRAGLEALIEA
jgi:CRP-like cAMP-binding protein